MSTNNETNEYRQHRFSAPAGATDMLLIRHGESAPARLDAPAPVVDGQADPDLDVRGLEEAQRVANRLESEEVSAIYVTNLRRTAQTAAPLAARLGIEPRVEPDLREVHLGEWEGGLFRQKAAESDPVFVRAMAEERWDLIPGAEPLDTFRGRVTAGLGRIVAAHRDERVVVVTHGGVIGQILSDATRARPFAFVGVDNASISHLVVSPERTVLRRFNDTTHLEAHFSVVAPPPI